MSGKSQIELNRIVKGCKKNDPKSQQLFYEVIGPKVMGICLRYIKDKNFAQDIFQEVMVKLLWTINKFKKGDVYAWSKRVAVNQCIDYQRKMKGEHIFIEYLDEDKVLPKSDVVVEMELMDDELYDVEVEMLHQAIDCLPDRQRLILQMHVVDGYKHKEIGEALEISEDASKSLLKRAKKNVSKTLLLTPKKKVKNSHAK